MAHQALFTSVMTLTDKAKEHAKQADFECCLEKLMERQILLERLNKTLEQQGLLNHDNLVKSAYVELIQTLKLEDKAAMLYLSEQRLEMQGKFKHQSKVKKAMNAYHNVLLSK
ncbi:MAG: hypothetical protein V7780_00805 [Colwellia sp.]